MNKPSVSWHILGVGLLVLVAVVVLGQSVSRIGFYRRQIENRSRELADLQSLGKEMAARRAALDWINATARDREPLMDLSRRHLAGVKTDLVLRETGPAGDAWLSKRYDLRMDQVVPDKLAAFLAAGENARPPLRLMEIQITAPRDSGSALQAQLSLAELIRR